MLAALNQNVTTCDCKQGIREPVDGANVVHDISSPLSRNNGGENENKTI